MPNGEITAADVQSLSCPEELRRFLGTLGYDVSDPVEQTAASLGVAERFQHAISQAHRVAAERLEPGLDPALEVYWFEVSSLTADLRKAVVSAFRNKPAQTLLILTTKDFDPIDFALVQRAPRKGPMPGGPAISHRLFSLDRRNPTRVHLRVLNRMANKAGDPYAQYDRIKDAFRVAEWSEDEFNNRNLFSDYFLKHRLPRKDLFPVFHRDVRPARREVSDAFEKTGDIRNLKADELEDKLVKPLMAALGFEAPKAARGGDAADYLLEAKKDSSSATVALLVYPWDRSLDRKDDRDPDRPEDVPGIRVVRALEHHDASWAILTNGKDGTVTVEIKGLDVYDPTTGEVRSSSTDDIACWFIDTNYNGESFFVRHAYFTGADEPYDKLKRALRAEIDEDAWSKLYSTKSRSFAKPETGKIAIKVINHYGDEVMKVYEVGS